MRRHGMGEGDGDDDHHEEQPPADIEEITDAVEEEFIARLSRALGVNLPEEGSIQEGDPEPFDSEAEDIVLPRPMPPNAPIDADYDACSRTSRQKRTDVALLVAALGSASQLGQPWE